MDRRVGDGGLGVGSPVETTIVKRHASDLAVCGGPPAFAEPLAVGRPNVGDRQTFLARVEDMLDRRWFTNRGPFVEELEARLAAFLGVRHCVTVCNATVALEITARALGLRGEVIVPSFTFVATPHSLQWQEITPVFCDVDPATHNLDPRRVEELVTPRTSGIVGVHVWGRPCAVDALEEIARRRGLALIYDAAHAFACRHAGRMVGGFGQAEVFSFHATKFFNTFEGGAVATDDDGLARKIRLMTNFGFEGYDTVTHLGTNGKMSEVCAAMGLASLAGLDEVIAVNRARHEGYARELGRVPGLSVMQYDDVERSNYQYVVLEVDETAAGLTRDELKDVLWAENVLARRYFYPGCHRMEPYRSLFPHAGLLLGETERLTARVLSLPTGPGVAAADIATVASVMSTAVRHADVVAEHLRRRKAEHPESPSPR